MNAELFEQMLEQQAETLRVRKEEIELQKQQDVHNYEFAKASLSTQAEDRERQRSAARAARRDRMYFSGFVILVLSGFVGYSLFLGREEFARETLKALVFLGAGGLGGYSFARTRGRNGAQSASGG
ncbi:MAG: hypothetical protein KF709_07915 [Gemmatimonadaceae bacterium]|nr:hypothetical protein [Gemmatimonadaceae bacterium]